MPKKNEKHQVGQPSPQSLADMAWPQALKDTIVKWIDATEKLHLGEYVEYMEDRKRRIWGHFLGGLARGVGMAVGFTILGAVLVIMLQDLARRNLPVIGDFLAQIVSVVQTRLP